MRRFIIPISTVSTLLVTVLTASMAHASLLKDSVQVAKPETNGTARDTQPEAKLDPPTPTITWLKWTTFDKLYFGKLNGRKTTDEERLNMLKVASKALDGHLTALAPEQLLRVIATMQTESARFEALAELVTSTRYNNDDISKITAPFSQMKNDAHALLIAVDGYGGY